MTIFLSTGTNLGDRLGNLDQVNKLIEAQIGPILQYSTIYQTAAWGGIVQPDYYNQVLQIDSSLQVTAVLDECLTIENEMGRIRKERWGARVIDIDLLFYEDKIIENEKLILPHPRLHLRNFVLLPLSELAPNWQHPIFNKDIVTLVKECPDDLEAKPLKI